MKIGLGALLGGGLVLAVLASLSLFTVDQREHAIVLQFGEIKEVVAEPGLRVKWPLIQNVRFFERRILTIDDPDTERFVTAEKKNLLVDAFLKWRIIDVQQYYISLSGDEARARSRLTQIVNSALREEIGERSVHEVVSGEREKIMQDVRQKVAADAKGFGIEIVDVRLKRVELPQDVSEAVYRRMEAERRAVASQLRSLGASDAEKIRAEGDKDREVIIAEAYRDAQRVKGEGDAKAAGIYAKAYGENAEFYAFYRSLEAYRSSFRNRSDVVIVEPTSDFFKYLRTPGGGGSGKAPSPGK
jgi:membrane protease subunit HflC